MTCLPVGHGSPSIGASAKPAPTAPVANDQIASTHPERPVSRCTPCAPAMMAPSDTAARTIGPRIAIMLAFFASSRLSTLDHGRAQYVRRGLRDASDLGIWPIGLILCKKRFYATFGDGCILPSLAAYRLSEANAPLFGAWPLPERMDVC